MDLDSIFRAYDIRGKALTADIAYQIGWALAHRLSSAGPVVVGRDMRGDSKQLANGLIKGLTEAGREVWDIGLVTTDMVYFAVGKYQLAGGAMVTASHNPGEYNGIKLCREEAWPIGLETGLSRIKEFILEWQERGSPPGKPNPTPVITKKDISKEWMTHLVGLFDTAKWPAFKIAIDAGNGMAGAILPALLKHLPLKARSLYFELDGNFPNHPPDPTNPLNLRDLINFITQDQLDFGLAFDGDGDRVVFVDEKGRPLTSSLLFAVLAQALLENNQKAHIVYNLVCSRIVPETIKAHGGVPVRTRVGHSFIKAAMRHDHAPLGGEHSGHFYFKDNWYSDSGIITALMVIDQLAKSGASLSELVKPYQKYVNSGEVNFRVKDRAKAIAELVGLYKDGKIDQLDGLTIQYEDWWFNLRPSNTEPVVRLNVEAMDREDLEQHLTQLERVIERT